MNTLTEKERVTRVDVSPDGEDYKAFEDAVAQANLDGITPEEKAAAKAVRAAKAKADAEAKAQAEQRQADAEAEKATHDEAARAKATAAKAKADAKAEAKAKADTEVKAKAEAEKVAQESKAKDAEAPARSDFPEGPEGDEQYLDEIDKWEEAPAKQADAPKEPDASAKAEADAAAKAQAQAEADAKAKDDGATEHAEADARDAAVIADFKKVMDKQEIPDALQKKLSAAAKEGSVVINIPMAQFLLENPERIKAAIELFVEEPVYSRTIAYEFKSKTETFDTFRRILDKHTAGRVADDASAARLVDQPPLRGSDAGAEDGPRLSKMGAEESLLYLVDLKEKGKPLPRSAYG